MSTSSVILVLPKDLSVGDKIRYVKGKFIYVVTSIKSHTKHKTKIILVRVEENEGFKRYYRNPKHDFITEINNENTEGGYWDRAVELLEKEHYVPKDEQIEII